jgi:hypothetical protein
MDRVASAKRKRESPDEDEVAEARQAADMAKAVVNQVPALSSMLIDLHVCMIGLAHEVNV